MFTNNAACAAIIALSTTSAFAGGLSPEIVESPVIRDPIAAPVGTSIDPAYIVIGVLAALLVAAAVGSGDDDDEGEETDDRIERVGLCEIDSPCDTKELGDR